MAGRLLLKNSYAASGWEVTHSDSNLIGMVRHYLCRYVQAIINEVILMEEKHSTIGLISRLGMALFFSTWGTICVAQVADISQAELMQRMKANHAGLILDVRSPEEFAEGHIPSAINIPYDQMGSRHTEINSYKDKDVVLYCKSGKRAGIAANTLRTAGFSKLQHLEGDMSGWVSKGDLPIKK